MFELKKQFAGLPKAETVEAVYQIGRYLSELPRSDEFFDQVKREAARSKSSRLEGTIRRVLDGIQSDAGVEIHQIPDGVRRKYSQILDRVLSEAVKRSLSVSDIAAANQELESLRSRY